jgi:hypothetical protein
MRHYHKQPNHYFRPTINIDKVRIAFSLNFRVSFATVLTPH